MTEECQRIARWFIQDHREWIQGARLKSWAEKLDIKLNTNGILDVSQLFHLFLLALLWNNPGTYRAKTGERVFQRIKGKYTLENFIKAAKNNALVSELKAIDNSVWNPHIFNTLSLIANGKIGSEKVWTKILRILTFPEIGNKEDDINRLSQLFNLFNPPRPKGAFLTVKTFLIFREIRIQFRDTRKFLYHPAICCVPDSKVRSALHGLHLLDSTGNDFQTLKRASQITSANFCTDEYELYDLPLFLWSDVYSRCSRST